jgi:hypothetical protein
VHHSGSGWLARPSPWGTCTSYSLPAFLAHSAVGHFETKSGAYRCASIGLILLQKLTFWSTRNVDATISDAASPVDGIEKLKVRIAELEAENRSKATLFRSTFDSCGGDAIERHRPKGHNRSLAPDFRTRRAP